MTDDELKHVQTKFSHNLWTVINTDPHQASNTDIRSIKIYYEQVRMTDYQYSIMLTKMTKLYYKLSNLITKF